MLRCLWNEGRYGEKCGGVRKCRGIKVWYELWESIRGVSLEAGGKCMGGGEGRCGERCEETGGEVWGSVLGTRRGEGRCGERCEETGGEMLEKVWGSVLGCGGLGEVRKDVGRGVKSVEGGMGKRVRVWGKVRGDVKRGVEKCVGA